MKIRTLLFWPLIIVGSLGILRLVLYGMVGGH